MSAATPFETFQALKDPSKRHVAYPRLLELLSSSPDQLLTTLKDLLADAPQIPCALEGLSALFELDAANMIKLVQNEQLQQQLHKVARSLTELSPPHSATDNFDARLKSQLAFAQLLSTTASQQTARSLLQSLQAEAWLESVLQSENEDIRTVSCVALAKLLLSDTANKPENFSRLNDLAEQLIATFAQSDSTTKAYSASLEGIAILTLLPKVRCLLFDAGVLPKLCKPHVDTPKAAEGSFGNLSAHVQNQFSIACIYCNITSYKPVASDTATERLKQLAIQAGAQREQEVTGWESDDVVEARGALLIGGGIMDTMGALVRSRSLNARRKTGVALANLTRCSKQNRGILLQQGAATIFLNLARQEPTGQTSASDHPNEDLLSSIQGLARLLITANPALALTSALQLEAIQVLSTLFVAQESNLLGVFEALMALTNLCSLSEEARSHFVTCQPSNMSTLDSVMLYDDSASKGHLMCRRAATQLACNLTMCEAGFAHFAGDADLSMSSPTMPSPKCQSRLHLLLALCDVDDMDTRMAASAALAMLTVSLKVCCLLIEKKEIRQRSLDILASLIDRSAPPGLRQRGLACISNIIQRLGVFPEETQKRFAASPIQAALKQVSGKEMSDAAPLLSKLSNYA